MNEYRRRSLRQCGVWIVALAGHLLLYLLFVRVSGPPDRQRHAVSEQPGFVMLELYRPVEQPALPPEVQRGVRRLTSPSAERRRTDEKPLPNSAIRAPTAAAPVDWDNAARIAAHAATDGSGKPTARQFGEPVKSPRARCEKRASSFEWNPEPKKAGFAGIVPYVRLGKRCIVGLGFFGCTLGALPEPNSHLLDDMRDADRITNSVPDIGCD